MSLKLRAGLGLATVILTIVSIIGGAVTRLETRFAALDTRLGKLESAIKTLNATTPDDRYKQLVKELIAERERNVHACTPAWRCEPEAGAAADAPAVKVPQ